MRWLYQIDRCRDGTYRVCAWIEDRHTWGLGTHRRRQKAMKLAEQDHLERNPIPMRDERLSGTS